MAHGKVALGVKTKGCSIMKNPPSNPLAYVEFMTAFEFAPPKHTSLHNVLAYMFLVVSSCYSTPAASGRCRTNAPIHTGVAACHKYNEKGESTTATDIAVFGTWRELRMRRCCARFGRGTNSGLDTQRRPWLLLAQTFPDKQSQPTVAREGLTSHCIPSLACADRACSRQQASGA